MGGDTTATYAIETGDCSEPASKQYTGFDIAMWDWIGYVDPDFMLSVVHAPAVVLVERHRAGRPRLRQAVRPAGQDGRSGQRKQIVYRMQKIVYDNFVYTQLVNEQVIDAHAKTWTGFYPELSAILEAVLHLPCDK